MTCGVDGDFLLHSDASRTPRRALLPAFAMAVLSMSLPASAARIGAELKDASGAPLADAVIYAEPATPAGPARARREVQIEQIDKTFVPFVTVVQTGTPVNFPNRDSIRHHVYSFSPAKIFEIKLFSGVPVNPVTFDKPGEVVLGCNIHDTMIAYLLVVDTPYFAKTGKDGRAQIDNLPAGSYQLKAWHHSAAAPDARKVQLQAETVHDVAISLTPKPQTPRPQRK